MPISVETGEGSHVRGFSASDEAATIRTKGQRTVRKLRIIQSYAGVVAEEELQQGLGVEIINLEGCLGNLVFDVGGHAGWNARKMGDFEFMTSCYSKSGSSISSNERTQASTVETSSK